MEQTWRRSGQVSPPLCDESAAHLHVGSLNEHHWFLTLQVVWVRGAEAGKHNRQRQPPLRRAGPRPACQRHRQLCLEDDRLAEAMSADGSLWHLFFLFCFFTSGNSTTDFLPSLFLTCLWMNVSGWKRRSMCGVFLRFCKSMRELFFVDGLLIG